MNHLIEVFLLAIAPISELRGAIPVGLANDLPLWQVLCVSIIGNMLPVFFIILFLEKLSKFLSEKSVIFKRFFNWFFEYTKNRHSKTFSTYRDIGLVFLVAIPLPFTGAWTASICAFLFDIPLRRAFYLIAIGVIIASIIVTLITLGVINIV